MPLRPSDLRRIRALGTIFEFVPASPLAGDRIVFRFRSIAAALSSASLLAGCVAGPAPANVDHALYAPQQLAAPGSGQPRGSWTKTLPAIDSAARCVPITPRELYDLRQANVSEFAEIAGHLAFYSTDQVTVEKI